MNHEGPPPSDRGSAGSDRTEWQPGPKLRGLNRLKRASHHSLAGLKAGWHEPAFRLEALAALPLLIASPWVGQDWVQTSLLAASVLAVLIVELLNTGLESVVDRVGPQWHELSKRAKDLGSAAVFLSLLTCLGIWTSALWSRLS